MTNYFLPISAIYLPSIYGSACIMPKKYIKNDSADVQDIFPSYLLLSTEINISKSDCVIEVILNKREHENLNPISKNFYLLSTPLPISRIYKLYFRDEKVRERMVAIININTAYINASRTTTIPLNLKQFTIDESIKVNENQNLSEQIKYFDRVLGGFALLKTVESSNDYPLNYFSTLSYFNRLIKQGLDNHFNINDYNSKLIDAFFGKDGFKDLYPYLYKEISENDIHALANKEGQQVTKDRLTGIINLESLEKMTYVLAILFNYGVGEEPKKNKIDSLIAYGFQTVIKARYSEIVALCYGINRGYKAFAKDYIVSDKKKAVKYDLSDKLTYYTIESIFNMTFHNQIENIYFPYLDEAFKFENLGTNSDPINIVQKVASKKRHKVGSAEYSSMLSQTISNKGFELIRPIIDFISNMIIKDVEKETETAIVEYRQQLAKVQQENQNLKAQIIAISKPEKVIKSKRELSKVNTTDFQPSENSNTDVLSELHQENQNLKYLIDKIEAKAKSNKAISKIIMDFKSDKRLL